MLSKEKDKELAKKSETLRKNIISLEEKDEKFKREQLYEYFNADSDATMTYKQIDEANELLKKRIHDEG